jgi:hypothetical protein
VESQNYYLEEQKQTDEMVYSYRDSQKDIETEDLTLRRNSSLK